MIPQCQKRARILSKFKPKSAKPKAHKKIGVLRNPPSQKHCRRSDHNKSQPSRPHLAAAPTPKAQAKPYYLYGMRPVMAALANPARHIHALYATEKAQMRIKEALPEKILHKSPMSCEKCPLMTLRHWLVVMRFIKAWPYIQTLTPISLQQFLVSQPTTPTLLVL